MALMRKLHYTYREWFLMGVDVPEDRDRSVCWLWNRSATKTEKGYGAFVFNGVRRYAHRVAYELENGPMPADLFVCHSCDNTLCCNPFHLFPGSQEDNMSDASRKGRLRSKRAKLTDVQVRELRKLRAEKVPFDDLEKRFKVNRASLWEAATGRTYKHVY